MYNLLTQSLSFLLIFSFIAPSQSFENNFKRKDQLFTERIRSVKTKDLSVRLLQIPESEIDISKIAYILAKDAFPSLNLDVLYFEFEQIIQEIKNFTGPDNDPEHRIRSLNTYLYLKLGIGYDKSDFQGEKLENRHIHTVLSNKTGACFNLAIFYIAVAQKLGYPVYAVSAPQHMFCRYVDPAFSNQNIEPTGKGAFIPDANYIMDMDIKKTAIDNGSYLRTMTNKELVAEMVADHASFFLGRIKRNFDMATIILHKAVIANPKNPENWMLLGQFYQKRSYYELDPTIKDVDYHRGLFMINKAKVMGINPPLEKEYWKKPLPSQIRSRM